MNVLCAIVIICASLYLAIKSPIPFTLLWGVVGSNYDACGIVSWLELGFPYYQFMMRGILLISCVYSVLMFFRGKPKGKILYFMYVALIFMLGIGISQIVVSIIKGISIVKNLSNCFVEFGPPIFIIWIANYEQCIAKKNIRKYISWFVCIQIIIACLIVYLPIIGIHAFDSLSGANYIQDGWVYNRSVLTNLFDLPKMFANKYTYNGLGQFHNGNDMGLYGVAGIFVALCYFLRSNKLLDKIVGAILILLSLLLWGNSGMRGPVIGLAAGLVLVLFLTKSKWKWRLLIGLGCIGVIFLITGLAEELLSYLIPSSDNISFTSREELRVNGIKYLKDNWLFGAGGLLAELVEQSVNPHELPLRISVLFGVFTGAVSVVLIYILPVIIFSIKPKAEPWIVVSWFIVFFTSITNNYTCIALFWVLFSEAICSMLCTGERAQEFYDRAAMLYKT